MDWHCQERRLAQRRRSNERRAERERRLADRRGMPLVLEVGQRLGDRRVDERRSDARREKHPDRRDLS